MNEQTPYAVRWAHGYCGDRVDFTTFHSVVNEGMTACGHRVPSPDAVMALEAASIEQTRCGQCLRRYDVREALKVSV